MQMFRRAVILNVMFIAALSAACAGAPSAQVVEVPDGPQVWIDAPLDGAHIDRAAYDVVSHAGNGGSVSAFELSANGKVVRTDRVTAQPGATALARMTQTWVPSSPGQYVLTIRAANASGTYGPPTSVTVVVADAPNVASNGLFQTRPDR